MLRVEGVENGECSAGHGSRFVRSLRCCHDASLVFDRLFGPKTATAVLGRSEFELTRNRSCRVRERRHEPSGIESSEVNNYPDGSDALATAHNWNRNRTTAERHFLTRDRIPSLANLGEFCAELLRIHDRIRGWSRERLAEVMLTIFIRLKREQHLADTRCVQRQMSSRSAHCRHASFADESVNVECLAAVEHRECDVFSGLLIQSRERWQRAFAESIAQWRVLRNRPQPRPDAKLAVTTAAEKSALNERGGNTVTGLDRELRQFGEF